MRKKQVKHTVQCAVNPDHLFDKVYDIKEGSEEAGASEVEAYCARIATLSWSLKSKAKSRWTPIF